MSRILDARLTLRHLLLVGVAALTLAIGGTVLAASPQVFPAGTIHLASAKATSTVSIPFNAPPTKVLSAAFNVPTGMVADVQTSFSATLQILRSTSEGPNFAYCFGRFSLDGANQDANFAPGTTGFQLIGGNENQEPDAISASMTGFRTNIGSGAHHVNVYIVSSFDGCDLQERVLNVVINLHRGAAG